MERGIGVTSALGRSRAVTNTPIEQAAALRLDGRITEALALCDRQLAKEPDNALAHGLRAACLAELGDRTHSRAAMDTALELAPSHVQIALYDSVVCEAEEDLPAAKAAAERAIALAPDHFAAWGRLGDLAGRVGDFQTAYTALDKANTLSPGHEGIVLRLAGASLVLQDFTAAEAAFAQVGPELRQSPDALHIELALAQRAADWVRVSAVAEALLSYDPHDDAAVEAQAHALAQQGYFNKASRLYRPLVERAPDRADKWAMLGRFRLGARDLAEALSCFEKAQGLDPDHVDAVMGRARVMTYLGRFEEAEAACRTAIKLNPAHVDAYAQLCDVAKGRLTEAEFSQLATVCQAPDLELGQRAIALFAKGDALHAQGEHDAAFGAWKDANDARIQYRSETRKGYEAERQAAEVALITRGFPDEVDVEALALTGPQPIFIVGMPRSGTTLLEAVIAAHDKVEAGGELPVLPIVLRECLDWMAETGFSGGPLPEEKLQAWRRRYLAQYDLFNLQTADKRYVTDKQPANIFAVGLIRQLFPKAPILHIRRAPLETGFSIYRRNFSTQWPFADRMEDIADYYGQYARVVRHFEDTQPDAMRLIQYEDLVTDFENRVRTVLSWCRLDFQRPCLEFYKMDRAVMTFSATQVRQAPSPKSMSSTGPYIDHLAPLQAALEACDVDLRTGALITASEPEADVSETPDRKSGWRRWLGVSG